MNANGVKLRNICKLLKISRNTVRRVIRGYGQEQSARASKYEQHLPAIRDLFRQCSGNVVRVREEISARFNMDIPYQTLTWLVRKYEIRIAKKKRSGEYTFGPGEEMQHDTSPHSVEIGGRKVTAQCASLVLAYSRKLFIQYYPCFTRFECRVFLAKAFQFMDGICPRCIIDNTSVIVAGGSGPDAVIAPEMEYFGNIYGVTFKAHVINDADRKARVERNFSYAEKNFLAGRKFTDWHDLNRQAEDWCGHTANRKPKRSLGRMSPDEAYILEKPSIKVLPPYLPPVYQSEYRTADIQGYVHLDTNRYSVPEALVGERLEVQKRWDKVLVYNKHKKVAEHDRLIDKRDAKVKAPGHHPPLMKEKVHRGPCREEKLLAGSDASLDQYIAELKKRSRGRGLAKLRRLLNLQRTYPRKPFLDAVGQALKYGLYDLTRLEKIILDKIAGDFFNLS
jgi:transposase